MVILDKPRTMVVGGIKNSIVLFCILGHIPSDKTNLKPPFFHAQPLSNFTMKNPIVITAVRGAALQKRI